MKANEVSAKDRLADLLGWYGAFGCSLKRSGLRNKLLVFCKQTMKEAMLRRDKKA